MPLASPHSALARLSLMPSSAYTSTFAGPATTLTPRFEASAQRAFKRERAYLPLTLDLSDPGQAHRWL
jgi:hypothetical protein